MNGIEFITAFSAGILSFLSPCVLPLLPGYISFISGISIKEMQELSDKKRIHRGVILSTIFFVIGFSLVFIALGASATIFGKLLTQKFALFSKIAGVLIILFGFHVLGLLKLDFLHFQKKLDVPKIGIKYLSSFLLGVGFAFGWSPCIGPILAGILLFASQEETVTKGIMLLAVYSLGLAVPFIITAVSINLFLSFFNKIKKYYRAIEILAGVLLILMGILIFFGKLEYLIAFLPFLK
ncbi:MAG: cytochrome c biogenesis protein CcdA [bacterium]